MPRSPPSTGIGRAQSRLGRLLPAALALLVTLGLLGALLLYWRVVAPGDPPVAIPWLVAPVVAVALLQACRAALADDWLRRVAALAVPVGVAVALLGLHPDAACEVLAARACAVGGQAPNPALLAAGAVATAVPVYLDLRRRSVAREPDPIA